MNFCVTFRENVTSLRLYNRAFPISDLQQRVAPRPHCLVVTPLFYLQFRAVCLWRSHRWTLVTLSATCVIALGVLLTWIDLLIQQSPLAAQREHFIVQRPVAKSMRVPASTLESTLPPFVSAEVVAKFGSVARDVDLPLEEVSYVFEGANDQPFLRYRINMSVKTGYAHIRRFVAALAVEMPHVSLDTIRCGRENAAAQLIGCELAFSAFFERKTGG